MALRDDIKYGFRTLTKNAGFTSVALLTISLSIAAVTVVFSVVDAVLLKPLPYAESEKIIFPWRLAPKNVNLGYEVIPWGISNFQRITNDSRSFQNVCAFKAASFNLTGGGRPLMLEGARVSAGFFDALGVHPYIGRTFTSREDTPGYEREVILSNELWQQEFQGNRDILGRAISLNGQPYTVVGIMPDGFAFPRGEEMPESFGFPHRSQVWTPLALPAVPDQYAPDELAIVGRLRPGVKISRAQAEMNLISHRLEVDVPANAGWFNSRVTPLPAQIAGNTRLPLLLTLSAAGIVLLIASSNIANLILARSLNRSSEFSLRVALGAGRARIIKQLVMESLILASAGGLLGIYFVIDGIRFVKALGPENLPRLQDASLDLRVLVFAACVTLLSGILFGFIPAIAASRSDLSQSLRAGGRGSIGTSKAPMLRNALLRFETALALLLVIASSLLAQTFLHLLRVDPGFNPFHVLTFELSLPRTTYKDDSQIAALYLRALQRLRSIPDVESVGLTQMLPMDGATDGSRVRIPDSGGMQADEDPIANYTIASSGYFAAAGIQILRGRAFLDSDTLRSQQVAIISQTMAKKFWPGKDPVGRQVGLASDGSPLMTIVGIVPDVKHTSVREDSGPEMYVPYTQQPFPSMQIMRFVVRSKADPKYLTPRLEAEIHALDSGLPIARVTALQTILNASLAGQRFAMVSLCAFAALSLFLAASGMYGVISFSINQRTREMGVRMALGATRPAILIMIVRQGTRIAGEGMAFGLLTAIGLTRLMAASLYGIRPVDVPTFALVTVALLAVAALACYVPGRRATRVDPLVALRCD